MGVKCLQIVMALISNSRRTSLAITQTCVEKEIGQLYGNSCSYLSYGVVLGHPRAILQWWKPRGEIKQRAVTPLWNKRPLLSGANRRPGLGWWMTYTHRRRPSILQTPQLFTLRLSRNTRGTAPMQPCASLCTHEPFVCSCQSQNIAYLSD